jgi:hypothetical protein
MVPVNRKPQHLVLSGYLMHPDAKHGGIRCGKLKQPCGKRISAVTFALKPVQAAPSRLIPHKTKPIPPFIRGARRRNGAIRGAALCEIKRNVENRAVSRISALIAAAG